MSEERPAPPPAPGSAPDLGHGPRLSGEEYDRRVVRLHEGGPPAPSRDEDRELRRAELDLAIDHRLGRDFPAGRRERLWEVAKDVERRRLRLIGKHLVGRVLRRRQPGPEKAANRLAGWMVERYAEVLDERELEAFFELGGEEPALPVDPEANPDR
jgi:hypothetical protein